MFTKVNRNSITTLSRIAAVLTLTVLATAAQAQSTSFDYLAQALTKIVAQASVINLANYDYVSGDSLFGAYLGEGGAQSLTVTFNAGEDYLILGGGGRNILDLDLTILSASGRELTKDTQTDATPIVTFSPVSSGRYTIKMSNYNSFGTGFCAFVVLHKTDSSNLNIEQIAQALGNALAYSQVASLLSAHFATGTFCLFGGKQSNGGSSFLYNTRLNSGRYVFLSAGSDNMTDLDNSIARQDAADDETGNIIASDTRDNAHPACAFEASYGNYYLLKHKAATTRYGTDGFMFSFLLKIDD